MEMEKVLSSRGKQLLVFKNFKFCQANTSKDGTIRWRCTFKQLNCPAKVYTNSNHDVIKTENDHNHEEHQQNECCKGKAADDISDPLGEVDSKDSNKLKPKPYMGGPGLVLRGQVREIIYRVFTFMKKEAAEGIAIPVKHYMHRTLVATGISRKTLLRISIEGKEIEAHLGNKFKTPLERRPRCKMALSPEAVVKLKGIVETYESVNKVPPTLRDIWNEMKKGTGFSGSVETLRKLMKDLGYSLNKGPVHVDPTQVVAESDRNALALSSATWPEPGPSDAEPTMKIEVEEAKIEPRDEEFQYLSDEVMLNDGCESIVKEETPQFEACFVEEDEDLCDKDEDLDIFFSEIAEIVKTFPRALISVTKERIMSVVCEMQTQRL